MYKIIVAFTLSFECSVFPIQSSEKDKGQEPLGMLGGQESLYSYINYTNNECLGVQWYKIFIGLVEGNMSSFTS